MLTSVDSTRDIASIASFLGLNKTDVRRVVDFLVAKGLCHDNGGRLSLGTQRTHLPADSLLAARHHTNWRLKTIEWSTSLSEEDLMYTSLVSLSNKDAKKILEMLKKLIGEINPMVDNSKSDKVAILNIDWVELKASKPS